MTVYTITLRNPGFGSYDVTLDAAGIVAARAAATRLRDEAGKDWDAVLYRVDGSGALEYVVTRTAKGWRW